MHLGLEGGSRVYSLNGCFLPSVVFNFILHDRRKNPIFNIIMWTSLFLGQGVLICLYGQELYARQYCPRENVSNLFVIRIGSVSIQSHEFRDKNYKKIIYAL